MGDDAESLKHHHPQYPLPEEIRKMARDETVCKYCGVSYLIHNEIKALEEKLKERDRQLAYYEGSEAREAQLIEELRQLQDAMEKCNLNLTAKDTVITVLQSDLKAKVEMLENVKAQLEKANEQLAEATHLVAAFRLKEVSQCERLAAILADLIQQKNALKSLQRLVQDRDRLLKDECDKINTSVKSAGEQLTKEKQQSDSRRTELEEEKNISQQQQKELRQQLMTKETKINELKDAIAMSSKLAEEKTQLESEKNELLGRMNEIADHNNVLTLENDMFQQTVKKQSNELEQSYLLQLKVQQAAEQVVAKLKQELALCQTELSSRQQKLEKLENAYEERKRLKEEVERMASLSAMRSGEVSEALHQAQSDLEALKNEREMMITAHQNQIEQLRESFKRRVADVDKWPEKMEQVCRTEREKHAQEMSRVEESLKEGFTSEMQIQKQKYDELVEKYRGQMRETENKLKLSLREKHQAEVNALHQQMAASKERFQDAEDSLRQEVASLKKIITELERKLASVDMDGGEKVQQLTGQLHELNLQLSQLKDLNSQLETQQNTSAEEIAFLQETVRRECEERFELTDALSDVKQELLAYKRLPGGHNSAPKRNNSLPDVVGDDRQLRTLSRRSSALTAVGSGQPSGHMSVRSGTSSRSSLATRPEELALFRKTKQMRPPDAAPRDRGAGLEKGLKGGSISESRRRIAHAVARHASDQTL